MERIHKIQKGKNLAQTAAAMRIKEKQEETDHKSRLEVIKKMKR